LLNCVCGCQLVLSLTLELDGSGERDKATLDALLTSLIGGLLQLGNRDVSLALMSTCSPRHEVKLVVLRLLSVLMSRTRGPTKTSAEVTLTGQSLYAFCGENFMEMSYVGNYQVMVGSFKDT